MPHRPPFTLNQSWSFADFLGNLFAYYRGGGIQSTGYRLNMMRAWQASAGRSNAMAALQKIEEEAEAENDKNIAMSLWMSESSYKRLKKFVRDLPSDDVTMGARVKAYVAYKWESGEHVSWVLQFAADLRAKGVEAILDQWDVRYGESFTTFMQGRINEADVILFVITPGSVGAAESADGQGGALQFEVQMMNARRIVDGVRIIEVYRSGDRPPYYLRDHRYVDFRSDNEYQTSLASLANDLLGRLEPPPVR